MISIRRDVAFSAADIQEDGRRESVKNGRHNTRADAGTRRCAGRNILLENSLSGYCVEPVSVGRTPPELAEGVARCRVVRNEMAQKVVDVILPASKLQTDLVGIGRVDGRVGGVFVSAGVLCCDLL